MSDALSKITPPIIMAKPERVSKLNGSSQIKTPISAVIAVPTPDQIAYAKLKGIVFKQMAKQ